MAVDLDAAADGLQHHAVALGQLQQARELLVVGLGVDREPQPDGAEADRRLAVDAERAADVELALGLDAAAGDRDLERRRHGPQRHARAGGERLEQHVAGARQLAGAAGRRMQAGVDDRPAGLDAAGDAVAVERAGGAQRDHRRVGFLAVALLDRRLEGAQLVGFHAVSYLTCWTVRR